MVENRLHSGWYILYLTLGIGFVLMGIDKFTNILTNWPGYLSPALTSGLQTSPQTILIIVGIIEILLGVLILINRTTRIGAYLLAAWLFLSTINLVLAEYYDLALASVMMGFAAIALGVLTPVTPGYYPKTRS